MALGPLLPQLQKINPQESISRPFGSTTRHENVPKPGAITRERFMGTQPPYVLPKEA